MRYQWRSTSIWSPLWLVTRPIWLSGSWQIIPRGFSYPRTWVWLKGLNHIIITNGKWAHPHLINYLKRHATTRAVKIVCERVSYLLAPKTNLPVGPARCHRHIFLQMAMLCFLSTYKVHLSRMAVCGVWTLADALVSSPQWVQPPADNNTPRRDG